MLISLAEFANEQDVTWVSRERLMARAECSARALTGYFKELEACGALSREARYEWCTSESCSRTGEHKHRRGTVYRIHPELRIDMRAATGAGSAPVRKTLESQRKSHSGKSCVCEDTVANPRRSQAQTPATITNRNEPPIEPPDPIRPSPLVDRQSPTEPSPVGSGTEACIEDQEVAASSLTAAAPPAEPGDPVAPVVARPVGAGAGSGGRSAPAAARTAPAAASDAQGAREPRRSPSGESESGGRSGGSGPDLALLGACLPEWALAMDARGARQVAALLAERIGGGWRPGEIRALMGEPPAGGARRMSALVAYRLRENVIPGSAPARAGEAVREAGERRAAERREATERAREAARTPEERAWSEAYARAWSEAQEELPGASRLEAAEWAAERARAALAAGAASDGRGRAPAGARR